MWPALLIFTGGAYYCVQLGGGKIDPNHDHSRSKTINPLTREMLVQNGTPGYLYRKWNPFWRDNVYKEIIVLTGVFVWFTRQEKKKGMYDRKDSSETRKRFVCSTGFRCTER